MILPMFSPFGLTFESIKEFRGALDIFLACKVEIKNEWKKVNINNLKTTKNLNVILERKFKSKVKTILDL